MKASEMPQRFVGRSFQIDTNRINASGNLRYMNRLEKWHEDGVINITMAETAQSEAHAGGNPVRAQKADSYIYCSVDATAFEGDELAQDVVGILFPDGIHTKNERKDVQIVLTAARFRQPLVTADGASKRQPGGLLGNRDKLAMLGIVVLKDWEAANDIVERIAVRDRNAKLCAETTGLPLPEWVGQD